MVLRDDWKMASECGTVWSTLGTMECKICGNRDDNRSYYPKEMMLGLRDKHHYFECASCGCLQIAFVPENLPDYYPTNYYSYKKNSANNPIKKQLIKLRDQYAVLGKSITGHLIYFFSPEPKLATLKELSLSRSSRIMDVGCGAGNLLYSLKEIGFEHLLGIDPFNDADIKYKNNLSIEKKSIHEASGEWDLIMFHHSFEHVYDQHEVLQKVHSLLAHNGTCLLRVPTTSSYAWMHYGIDWVQLDAPRHLFLHSTESMKLLAEKNGFKLGHVIYDSNALQFWGSEQYQQDIPLRAENSYAENGEASLFTKKEIAAFEKRAKELNALNQGDQAAFYLRKVT